MLNLILNFGSLLFPGVVLILSCKRGARKRLMPFIPLYIITSAFLAFFVLYILHIKSTYMLLWLSYYISSVLCGVLLLYILRGQDLQCEYEKYTRVELFAVSIFIVVIVLGFGCFHYVKSSSSAMYYIWMDVCKYWNETGYLYPELPSTNPANTFNVGLVYSPALLSVLTLLTAMIPQKLYFNAFGLLLAICHVGFLLALVEAGWWLFRCRWIGLVAFLLCMLNDPWSNSYVAVQLKIGSHNSALYYCAALLLLTLLYIWRRHVIIGIPLFIWIALSALSMRPYLGPYILTVAIVIFFILVKNGLYSSLKKIISSYQKQIAALLLGMSIFVWQLLLLFRYGSLTVYDQSIMLAKYGNYSERMSDILSRMSVYFHLGISAYLRPIVDIYYLIMGHDYSMSHEYALMTKMTSTLLLLAVCSYFYKRVRQKKSVSKLIICFGFIAVIVFMASVLAGAESLSMIAGFAVPVSLIAASWPYMMFGSRALSRKLVMISIPIVMVISICIPVLVSQTSGNSESYIQSISKAQIKHGWRSWRARDDILRDTIARAIRDTGGKVMLIRVEPGADAVFYVPGQYYWTQRFLWDDCDKIMDSYRWDPEQVASVLREQEILFILQPSAWSTDNHAGLTTLIKMKRMMDQRPDIYVPLIENAGASGKSTFYAIRLSENANSYAAHNSPNGYAP